MATFELMNWRILIGMIFLLAGVARLYMLMTAKLGGTPIYGEVGCVIWMLVGIYLVIKGMNNKPD